MEIKQAIGSLFLMLLLQLNLVNASGITSLNVSAYLNSTLLHGQQIPPLTQQSQVTWKIAAAFYGNSQSINATINQTAINYTDSSGTTSNPSQPIQLAWKSGPEVATYLLNGTKTTPIYLITSNTQVGSVSQLGLYSTATSAPQCSTNNFYTEWDFYVTVIRNYTSQSRNVVVGRICFYNNSIGYSQSLPKVPITQLLSTLALNAGTQEEVLVLNNTSTSSQSSDGLVKAQGTGNYTQTTMNTPYGGNYFAINTTAGQWIIQSNAIYTQWYNQYYSFALNFIPKQNLFYSPTNMGSLPSSCNTVSTSNLTNQSIINTVQCINSTSQTYYTKANSYAMQLLSSTQNVSAYPTSITTYKDNLAVNVDLPTRFVSEPKLTLFLNGAFAGLTVPAGKPEIFSVTSTTLNAYGIGTITTQLENVGNSPAIFNVSIENCPGVYVPSGYNYQLLQGQGEEITTAIVSSNSSSLINEQCTVVVNDLSGGGSATATVAVSSGLAAHLINILSNILKAFKLG